MKPLTIQGIVLVLMLVALPLASLGTTTDQTWLAPASLAVFGLAALVPPAMRFVGDEDADEEESTEDTDGDGGDSAGGEDSDATEES
jgi:hypothetical protein